MTLEPVNDDDDRQLNAGPKDGKCEDDDARLDGRRTDDEAKFLS
jgi:hypothetical protein